MTKDDKTNAISKYMKTEKALASFADILGGERGAHSYVANVMLAVRNDDRLMACSMESIYTSALRAASLRLSVDPALGQAYLVAYSNSCTLLVGYKGLYTLAMRTNKYRILNVNKVYEGETWNADRVTGIHKPGGAKISDEVIGWFGFFQLDSGFQKTIYLTVEEIHKHGKKYSPSYSSKRGLWQTNPSVMEHKTAMRKLLKWGVFNAADEAALAAIDEDYVDFVEGDFEETEEKEAPKKKKKSVVENVEGLGFPTNHLSEEDHKPWHKRMVAAVRAKTHLQTDEEINEFLDDSGMGREATTAAVRIYAGMYQDQIKDKKLPHEAVKYARANWRNGGGK